MRISNEVLNGVILLAPKPFGDARGRFVKTFHVEMFAELGLPVNWSEEFYSTSVKGVIRGMHYQSPPKQHSKMVYCIKGSVIDVILDIRSGSPTYGSHFSVEISEKNCQIVVIPPGFAHGFCSLTDEAILQYKVSSVYSAENDAGVLWNSFGCDWPITNPIMSDRDKGLPALSDIGEPFRYDN